MIDRRHYAERLRQGSKLPDYPYLDEGLALRLYDTLGSFVGIGMVHDQLLTPHKILAPALGTEAAS